MRYSRNNCKCLVLVIALWIAIVFSVSLRARVVALRCLADVKGVLSRGLFNPGLNGVFPAPWGAVLLLFAAGVVSLFAVARWRQRRNARRFYR